MGFNGIGTSCCGCQYNVFTPNSVKVLRKLVGEFFVYFYLCFVMQIAQRIPRMVGPNTQVSKQSVLTWTQSHFYGLLLVFLY